MDHLTDDHLYQGAPKALTPVEQLDTDLADDELSSILRIKEELMDAAQAAFPHTDMDSAHAKAVIEELFDDRYTPAWRKYEAMASATWSRDIPTYYSMLVKERKAKKFHPQPVRVNHTPSTLLNGKADLDTSYTAADREEYQRSRSNTVACSTSSGACMVREFNEGEKSC